MHERWRQVVALLLVARTPLVFAAISNVWLMMWLARDGLEPVAQVNRALLELPLGLLLALTAVLAAGLHCYGSALNDALDARHDRLFHPYRPLPRGVVGTSRVVILAMCCLLGALLAAVMLGPATVVLSITVALLALFYNTVGKFVPAIAFVTLGLIRAGLMFAPNPGLTFIWPIWLAMTHVIACMAIAHDLQGKRPPLSGSQIWPLTAGWVFWTMALIVWMGVHGQALPEHLVWMWVVPAMPAIVFAVITWFIVERAAGESRRARRQRGNRFAHLAILWLILYDAGWLFGAGLILQGWLHLALFIVAIGGSRLLGSQRLAPEPPHGYTVTERKENEQQEQ